MQRPSARVSVEWLLRAVAIGLIAVLWWRSWHPPVTSRRATATEAELATVLPQWTVRGVPDSAALHLQRAPGAVTRDWLTALRRAGMATTWYGDSLVPLVMSAERRVDPHGGILVRVGAPTGAPVTVVDDAGIIDTTLSRDGSAAFHLAALAGDPRVDVAGHRLTSIVADTLRLRRVLVLGRVGWEAKFTIAALEERGWLVDARMVLSPSQTVTQGAVAGADTSRYAAVVVLDSSAVSNPSALTRYVNDGGGLVVAGGGAHVPGFAPLLPGRAGSRVIPRQRLTDATDSEGARLPIVGLRSDAVVLERDQAVVTIAARRAGAGRVIQLADEESWRKRMRRTAGTVELHREWWARVVGSVAYAPRMEMRPRGRDASPLASLVDALGPPTARAPSRLPARDGNPEVWMFALLSIALLVEWASRRWRGAP